MVRHSTPVPISLAKIPFADIVDPSPQLIKRLTYICETLGFFIISDHNVPMSLYHDVIDSSRNFFCGDEAVKERYSQKHQVVTPKTSRGFSRKEKVGAAEKPDAKALFDLGLDRPLRKGINFTGPTLMPTEEEAPGFASSLQAMQNVVMDEMFTPIKQALALALGKDRHFLDESMADPLLIQRVIFYQAEKGRAGKHTDGGMFTLLFQEDGSMSDGHGSLKVHSQGQWIPVEANERECVVNLGDAFQFLSSGIFKSTPHMVEHSGKCSRVSIPFFFYPGYEAKLVPIETESEEEILGKDVIENNYHRLWVIRKGAGRAKELMLN